MSAWVHSVYSGFRDKPELVTLKLCVGVNVNMNGCVYISALR